MAFLPSSRYAQLATVDVPAPDGRVATIVKLRRLPPTDGELTVIAPHDRLDILAHERYGDSTEFWHIADANSEIDAAELAVPNNTIRIPTK
jgi:nucleoid-associated protein YgaU